VVTAGAAGAAIGGPDVAEWARVPAVTVRNPIGAGDSFLAGLVTARESGRDWPAAIRRGLATGSASVEQDGAGVVDPARVDDLEAALLATVRRP
jgi:sugar/nucleoside kinase (ribokinase family)